MNDDDRVKRPKVERSEPRRNWSFGPAPNRGAGGASPAGDAGAASDAVARAVELGYRVVDEYIRLGQRAARGFTDAPSNGGDGFAAWQDAASRMGQLTAEWMGLWFEFAQRAASGAMMYPMPAPGAWPTPAPPRHDSRPSPAGGTGEAPARVRIEIASHRPTEVALDLHPDSIGASLIIHSLRAVDAALPRLEECTFTPASEGEAAAVSIRVPAEHPAGTYSGAIVDAASSRPVGTLSVTVS